MNAARQTGRIRLGLEITNARNQRRFFSCVRVSAASRGRATTLRIRHALRLLSPLNYKVATTLSVDGGPFRNYGNPWWRKDAAAASR